MVDYVKMSSLVDQDFRVDKVGLHKFVAWDATENKYVTQDTWFQGAQKKYPVTTDKGLVDMSASQIGNMLEGVQHAGQSNIIGATFHVKSNGKTGKEIRYFLNPVKTAPIDDINQDVDPFDLPIYEGNNG